MRVLTVVVGVLFVILIASVYVEAYPGGFGTPASPLLVALVISALTMALTTRSETGVGVPVGIRLSKLVPANAVRLQTSYDGGVVASAPIFARRYGFKVGRVNAVTNAAEMVNVQPFWNWPNQLSVSDAMRHVIRGVGSRGAVTTARLSAHPEPTLTGFIDMAPEPVCTEHHVRISTLTPSAVVKSAPATPHHRTTFAERTLNVVSHDRSIPCMYA